MKRILSICMMFIAFAVTMNAKVDLPPVFADNMVLQQNADAAVWGKAKPGAKVTITTTWSKNKVTVSADADGKWSARIATPSAGGPYEITFNDGEKLTLKNVLIGEVWICSGQSNMDTRMKGYTGQPIAGAVDIITEAKPSTPIRCCTLDHQKSLTKMEECAATWFLNDPYGVSESSATAYFFALKLHRALDVPVGVINVSWGGTPIEAWMSPELLKKEFAGELSLEHIETGVWPEKNPYKAPGVLYNGMLHTVAPFTAKGFIWYQGCSNLGRHDQYKRLQPAFVEMLRDEWGNDKMPFYFTQIAPYGYGNPDAPDAGYMMWAQAQTLEMIPRSGMAATHDAGELDCIHPANKKVVGYRLAYLALANDYGMKGFDANPPMPIKFTFKDGAAYVDFECGHNGISPINKDLGCFELAGEDKIFYPATARIQKGNKSIKVTSPQVPNPVAVRYGMKNWSEATLFNNFGIPASPFRSDDWK